MQQLEAYERRAGRWIAAYRTLAPRVGRETPLMRRTLGRFRRPSFEDAVRVGERFVAEFGLGGIFVEALEDVALRAAPIDGSQAPAMIESVAAYLLLTGLRGQPPPTSTSSRPPSPASPSSPPPTPPPSR